MPHHDDTTRSTVTEVPDRWSELWEQHRPELVRYATRLLDGDTHTAEDVAQETAVRLWQRRSTLRTDEPIGPWLRTVARHIVVDRHRRIRARPSEVAFVAGIDPAVPDGTAGVEAELEVQSILEPLAAHHRAAVLEVYVRDRLVRDAADRLGIPEGTVKSRCHVALRKLRDTQLAPCA